MLPDPDGNPACFDQSAVRVGIAQAVSSEFGLPVIGVGAGWATVIGAGVPQAAVHEHSDLRPAEHDISAATDAVEREWFINAVPEPEGM
jgi:hypothetical protein